MLPYYSMLKLQLSTNATVKYYENHLATGNGDNKVMNPTTIVNMCEGSSMIMNTTQIGGVDYSNRKTEVKLKNIT